MEAQINFVRPDSRINRRYVAPGVELNTGRFEAHTVNIRDGRPFRGQLTLDTTGFTLLDHVSAVGDFLDRGEVDRLYPDEVVAAVRGLTGADRVLSDGWYIRTAGDPELLAKSTGHRPGGGGIQPPALDAHVDVHPDRAARYARRVYEKGGGGPGYRRFIISSFWRTFSEPPQDYPLAMCDGASVGAEEGIPNIMVVVDAVPDDAARHGTLPDEAQRPAASIFHYQSRHRWWYFPDMTRDEVIVLKFFDSDHSRPWRVPHTAFHDVHRLRANIRRSIECRTVAYFWE